MIPGSIKIDTAGLRSLKPMDTPSVTGLLRAYRIPIHSKRSDDEFRFTANLAIIVTMYRFREQTALDDLIPLMRSAADGDLRSVQDWTCHELRVGSVPERDEASVYVQGSYQLAEDSGHPRTPLAARTVYRLYIRGSVAMLLQSTVTVPLDDATDSLLHIADWVYLSV